MYKNGKQLQCDSKTMKHGSRVKDTEGAPLSKSCHAAQARPEPLRLPSPGHTSSWQRGASDTCEKLIHADNY